MIGLQIQTTPSCPGRCIICPHAESWLNKVSAIMTDEVFDKILKEVSTIKFKKFVPT